MTAILVINSGSSSFKYQLIDIDTETELAGGLVERIGEEMGRARHSNVAAGGKRHDTNLTIRDHTVGFEAMIAGFAKHGPQLSDIDLVAVGHRVVQGGAIFTGPTVITDKVLAQISELSALAPLHNPAHVQGIEAGRLNFPYVPHVAVFDTSFHLTMPAPAYTYAIDTALAAKHGIRRYGFHGSSHKYVSETAAEFVERPLAELKTIVLHLGNGASACAVDGGKSIDTSMGLTPLQGLVMGTRSGDIDPAVLFHLHRKAGYSIDQLDVLLNKKSGMLGLTGTGDMRDVEDSALAGDAIAQAALDVYYHRIRGYVGNYMAQLGGLDVIVFTAGVGENSGIIRERALEGLQGLGIEVDHDRNYGSSREARVISTDASRVTVLVIPTNEELEIARETRAVI